MRESDIPTIGRNASELIREIDSRYARGVLDGIEDLEARLEDQLEGLDDALYEIEDDSEPDQDLEPDQGEGCSIEEQFRAAYAGFIARNRIFALSTELASHLRTVLEEAQLGGMTPADFCGADDARLVELARELFQEQRAWIARLQVCPLIP